MTNPLVPFCGLVEAILTLAAYGICLLIVIGSAIDTFKG